MKTINNELIRSFRPCYDPSEKGIPDSETLLVQGWVEKYRAVVPAEDIIWLLCHEKLLGKRDLRLFAVWCAREALSPVENPDPRIVKACDVAERYANGEATEKELKSAADDAFNATEDAYTSAVDYDSLTAARAARAAEYAASYVVVVRAASAADAARAAVDAASYDATEKAQLEQLLTYFNY